MYVYIYIYIRIHMHTFAYLHISVGGSSRLRPTESEQHYMLLHAKMHQMLMYRY